MRSYWIGRYPALLALLVAAASCSGARASQVPLGGKHQVEAPPARAAASSSAVVVPPLPSVAAAVDPPATDDAEGADVEQAEPVVASAAPAAATDKAAASAFQLRSYAAGQVWTRSFDLEFNVKVGPGAGLDMRMVSHQEARFEVLAATAGAIDKLSIHYPVYTSKLSVMGTTQDSPEEIAGKRYVITFQRGKPDVKSAAGGTPGKKELDTVKDDAREPLEIAVALKELALLAAKGKGDFTLAGAIALAGGEDEDTKVSSAKASLRQLSTGPRGEKSALVDLAYTLTNEADEGTSIQAQLSGSLLALDAPARYHTVTLSGPVELRATEADGMAGRGTTKLSVTYKY